MDFLPNAGTPLAGPSGDMGIPLAVNEGARPKAAQAGTDWRPKAGTALQPPLVLVLPPPGPSGDDVLRNGDAAASIVCCFCGGSIIVGDSATAAETAAVVAEESCDMLYDTSSEDDRSVPRADGGPHAGSLCTLCMKKEPPSD